MLLLAWVFMISFISCAIECTTTLQKAVKATAQVGAFAIPGSMTAAFVQSKSALQEKKKIITSSTAPLEKVKEAVDEIYKKLERLFVLVKADRAIARKAPFLKSKLKRHEDRARRLLNEIKSINDSGKTKADFARVPALADQAIKAMQDLDFAGLATQ